MARAPPLSSIRSSSSCASSTSSAFPSPASPARSGVPRKKKIGALLSSYYNLDDESSTEKQGRTCASSSGAVTGERGTIAGASGTLLGAKASVLSTSQLHQSPTNIDRQTAGSIDRGRRGGRGHSDSGNGVSSVGVVSAGAGAAAVSSSFNPFSASEEPSSCLVSSVPGGSGDKREAGGGASYNDGSFASPNVTRALGGYVESSTSSSLTSSISKSHMQMRRSGDRGSHRADEVEGVRAWQQNEETEEENVLGAPAGVPTAAAAGSRGGVQSGATTAAEGGEESRGVLLGEEEDGSSSRSGHSSELMRSSEKEKGNFFEVNNKDLDSEDFDVRAFFSAAVENMSLRELLQASSRLDEEVRQCEGELQMLVYENYPKFLEAAETVRGVKEDMNALQTDMSQLAVRAAAIEDSSKELDDLVRDRAASIEELVSFRQLLDKLQILFTLPAVLRWYLSNDDTESVLALYLRLRPFLQQQENAFPTLQRLHLLHAEAATLFEAAKQRLRQQLIGQPIATPPTAFSSLRPCSSKVTNAALGDRVGGYVDAAPVTVISSSSSSNASRYLSGVASSSSTNSFVFDGVATGNVKDTTTSFLSAAEASRVFHLLLRAGEPPNDLVCMYVRNRMHLLLHLLQQVFESQRLPQAAMQLASNNVKSSFQEQQEQQQHHTAMTQDQTEGQQRQLKDVYVDGALTAEQSRDSRSKEAVAAKGRGESVAGAATTDGRAADEDVDVSSAAAAEEALKAACTRLSQIFMDPFVAALQDVLRLNQYGGGRWIAAAGNEDKGHAVDISSTLTGVSAGPDGKMCSAYAAGSARPDGPHLHTCDAGDRPGHAAAAAAASVVIANNGKEGKRAPSSIKAALMGTIAVKETEKMSSDALSIDALEESVGRFVLSLLLRLLEGFLRLAGRVNPPAAAVIETVRSLREVLLGQLQPLSLPQMLQQRITKNFQNFIYQFMSVCIAATFRSAYFQAAEELATLQRFCVSHRALEANIAPTAVEDVSPAEAAATTQQKTSNHSHDGVFQTETVCFFLDRAEDQETAHKLLSQKEHALLMRGCLAVTDVHKLIDGVCGVRSSLAQEIVSNDVSKWIEGFFSIFVAVVLRLARDTPAALQDIPLLQAEAEALQHREEAAVCCSSSSGNSSGSAYYSRVERRSRRVDFRKMSGNRSGMTDVGSVSFLLCKERDENNEERCYECCYCWRFPRREAIATKELDGLRKRQQSSQIEDPTSIAILEKALVSRCTTVEEEIQGAVAAAVVKHLRSCDMPQRSHETEHAGDTQGIGNKRLDAVETPTTEVAALHGEASFAGAPMERSAVGLPVSGNTTDHLSDGIPTNVRRQSPHTGTQVQQAVHTSIQKEKKSCALPRRTELSYMGRKALCCVLLMHLGRSLELHGVSKVVAVAAELFPSFSQDAFLPASPPRAASEKVAASDTCATGVVSDNAAGTTVPASVAAVSVLGSSRLSKEWRQQQGGTRELPVVVRLRQVLQAALVTYVYLRGCQGAILSTASLRKLFVSTNTCDGYPAHAPECSVLASLAGTSEPSAPSVISATAAVADTTETAETCESNYEEAGGWLELKDREAQKIMHSCTAINAEAAAGSSIGLEAAAAAAGGDALTEECNSPAGTTAGHRGEEPENGVLYLPAAHGSSSSSSSTSTAAPSLSPLRQGNAACSRPTESAADDRSDATAVREVMGDSAAVSVAVVADEATADSGGYEGMRLEVVGLMDTLLLLLHYCDEEAFVFLGEQKYSGSGGLLLRSGGVGGFSAALLPGSARLPRRLQAAAPAGDAAAAEQRQHQHVRRLARLFGRQRTALEKEMERLFARKQPVFSHVSLNRHKALMAIFKVACRPFLESVRSRHFTRFEVRQMQVECAAAAESLRDLVASEDGCVVDGLLDELVASSLRRYLAASHIGESAGARRIGHSSTASSVSTHGAIFRPHGPSPAAANDLCRARFPIAGAVRLGLSAAEGSLAAAYTRMSEASGDSVHGTEEDNGVLLEPNVLEEICNRSSDRLHQVLTSSIRVQ